MPSNGSPAVITASPAPTEKIYKPEEIAAMWRCSIKTVQRIFQDRNDVLNLGTPKKGKRSYETLRIPASTLERVFRERCRKG